MAPLPSPGSLQDVLEEWLTCQSSWLYLEPIFSSDDIMEQLPVEGKRYQHMENTWRRIMKSAFHKRKVGPHHQHTKSAGCDCRLGRPLPTTLVCLSDH